MKDMPQSRPEFAMNPAPLSTQQLRAAVDRLPRVRLAHLPTPLEEAPRFAERIGGGVRVFIKRDDCTGLLLGGNKTRHNEFLLGDAVAQKSDVLVWGASVQSNNCRQTAAGCAKLGLDCQLILCRGHSKTEPQGNLLLDYLVGAKVEFTDATIGPELDAVLAAKADELRKAGRRPYFWDRPRVVPLAAVSYTLCVAEIVDQLAALNLPPAALYVSSSGATGAGVALGKKLLNLSCPARLVCPLTWPWHIPTALANDANTAAEMIGVPHRVRPEEIDADETYVAPGYGLPSPAGREALKLLATTEAILLDPVYTAKALAALIADVRAKRYPPGSVLVFLHTGGVPAIFADPDSVLDRA
jgi:1-aminocyclopropane-1-carboxylate deaminase/D-cysteine desulfhydrase-like pyridoxal-dependent ACC family enzyme